MSIVVALERQWPFVVIAGLLGVSLWLRIRQRRPAPLQRADVKPVAEPVVDVKAAPAIARAIDFDDGEAEVAGEQDAQLVTRAHREQAPRAIVFASEANCKLLCTALPISCVSVKSRAEFALASRSKAAVVAFVDIDLLGQFGGERPKLPVIGIIDDAPSATLPKAVHALDSFEWLSHLVAASLLSAPLARSHLTMLLERLTDGPEHGMLGADRVGRVAMLARASRREARFERMQEFFAKNGLSARAISAIADVSEELVMNALYNAPVEAGYFEQAIPRSEEVELPPERACEISYGMDSGHVFVRLRDTFGALTRARLQDVLNRCNKAEVELDESRGGAGLGLWRIFSSASTIAITVIPGRLTDVVVGIAPKNGRIAKQLQAVHLFFVPDATAAADSLIPEDDSNLLDRSVTLVHVA